MSQLTTQETSCCAAKPEKVDYAVPAVNIHRDGDGYTLEAEMPGVEKSGVEITFNDGRLTLVGRRSAPGGESKAVYSESRRTDYRRVFDLDPSIDAGRISAGIEQGLLTVRLPKAEAAKPRRIEVA